MAHQYGAFKIFLTMMSGEMGQYMTCFTTRCGEAGLRTTVLNLLLFLLAHLQVFLYSLVLLNWVNK